MIVESKYILTRLKRKSKSNLQMCIIYMPIAVIHAIKMLYSYWASVCALLTLK